jgi:formamidopyrimidine-DNA glycosylase
MPELPDLEIVAEVLRDRLPGHAVAGAEVLRPIVVRDLTGGGFAAGLVGCECQEVRRRGKFLVFGLSSGCWLVIQPMFSGRLRLLEPTERRHGRPHVVLRFDDGSGLQYSDADQMGKVYLTPDLDLVPTFSAQGPEALDAELSLEAFEGRLRSRRGEIKGVLANQGFVAGIGNAYADEILFRARLYPYRKSPTLDAEERLRLYQAMRQVLSEAIEVLRTRAGTSMHEEVRDFLAIHGRGGQPCPCCGAPISQITARGRLTNFCRTCQAGSLIGG